AASFLPSRWYVEAISALVAGDAWRLLQAAGALAGFAVLGYLLLLMLAGWVLTLRRWSRALEGGGGPKDADLALTHHQGDWPHTPALSLRRLFFIKEWKFFIRDSQRFSNVSFILAVCAIYLVSIYRLPMDTPQLKNFLSFINLALGLFIIAALSLRFCFSQPSLELQYAWIIRAGPAQTDHLLGSKFLFNLIFLNAIGGLIVCVSPFLLGTDMALIPIYLAASMCCSTVFAVMSLALGSAFPKLHFENLIQIETSFGGFLYAVMTMAFCAVTLAVFAWPIKYFFQVRYLNYQMAAFDWAWLGVLGIFLTGLSGGASIFFWWLAKRSWSRLAL
ncbi:MAG: hypothetical protein AAB091_03500, partial [Elusimicrobiota bacterium]